MPADRLSALDIAFLCLEGSTTPMHMGAVATFTPAGPVDAHRVAALVTERAAGIHRLARRVRFDPPPFRGASWETVPRFDAADHVRVHHLDGRDRSSPGDPLVEMASAWLAAGLDTTAPLWEARVVTGLADGGFALLLKLHHALADGTGAARLALGLLDGAGAARRRGPAPAGTGAAEAGAAGTPRSLLETALGQVGSGVRDALGQAVGQAAGTAGIATAMLRSVRPWPPPGTLTANSPRRRLGLVRLDMAEVRAVRAAHGGTTNDVVLAVVAGALREWLRGRGREPDRSGMRALVPVSVRGRAKRPADGNALSGYLCDLPVEIDDPVERLRRVRSAMERNKRTGPTRGAGAFPVLAGRMPSGLHRLATRGVGHAAPLLFDTVVTNVGLPGLPMSLAGAPLRDVYPFVPLAPHQSLGIAVVPYRSGLHVGLQVNADAVDDVDALSDAVTKSLSALYHRRP